MAKLIIGTVLVFALTVSVRSQFFGDIFQSYQPFAANPSLRQIYEDSTRRHKTDQYNNQYRQTTKIEQTTKSYENDRSSNVFSSQIGNSERRQVDRRRKTTSINSNYYTTTVKPRKVKDSSRFINNDSRDQSTQVDNDNVKEEYDGKINSISDYYTESNRRIDNYNYYTTHNALLNRPGVKPAVVDNRPPITNRPVTRPGYGSNPRPRDEDAIAFPDDEDVSPEVRTGPDEDYMSQADKKRYIELAERMCDKYKALGTTAVQAIPLLPSPEPVQVNVSNCAPTNIPLVVGGKVVTIKEFPHMALLGWQKIQEARYSWKCGGSLVSEQFVLTAAHCSYQDRDNTVVNGPPRAVQLGSSYLDDPGALVVKVAAVIRHPKYKQPRSYYDLALVKLVNAVKFSEMIKPACLGVPPAVGRPIIATGWGKTEYGGDQSHELRSVSLPVWEMSRCREVLGTSRKLPEGPMEESQICAGEQRGGKDTCQGDSGGPAQLQEGCIWRVVAVTSLGRSCGAVDTPGLYATVQKAFIASQIFSSQSNDFNSNRLNNPQSPNVHTTQRPSGNNQDYNNQNDYNRGRPNRPSQVFTTTQRPIRNDGDYDYNRDRFNRGQGGQIYTTQKPLVNNENYNSQNDYNRDRPSVNYNNENVYNTQRPDRNNVQIYDVGSDVNTGQQNNNYYNQQETNSGQNVGQRPNRNDNSGSLLNSNDYNRQQNEQTTRKPTRNNNGNRGIVSNSNIYNVQNYESNNDYNSNSQFNRRNTNNYENPRPVSYEYTVNRPWWS